MVVHCLPFLASLQDFLNGFIFNPTFRFASCGAEISRPFGASQLSSSILLQ
ncbi:hypothetical protein Barb6_03166 [Bacteroidales bacterium Barb6]|nr:hypothetical protein Barb6_03166 [Bacteroidales bacterium Barb6]